MEESTLEDEVFLECMCIFVAELDLACANDGLRELGSSKNEGSCGEAIDAGEASGNRSGGLVERLCAPGRMGS